MEAKKNPKLRLERWRAVFFQIGLIISIVLVLTAFEWKFYDKHKIVETTEASQEQIEIVPITELPPPEPPKPKVIAKEFIEVLEEEEIEIPEIEIVIDQEEIRDYEPPVIEEAPEEEVADTPFLIVEDMPEPKGGYSAFYKFVSDNLQYPRQALNLEIDGVVFVQFVIDEKGKITNPIVAKGIGAGCDEEAIRVVKMAPDWKPGKQRGQEVKVQVVVPIRFKIIGRG